MAKLTPNKNNMAKFGTQRITVNNRIKEYRNKIEGLSQAKLAVKLGLTVQAVVKMEGNKHQPSMKIAEKLLEIFELEKMDDLFYFPSSK